MGESEMGGLLSGGVRGDGSAGAATQMTAPHHLAGGRVADIVASDCGKTGTGIDGLIWHLSGPFLDALLGDERASERGHRRRWTNSEFLSQQTRKVLVVTSRLATVPLGYVGFDDPPMR